MASNGPQIAHEINRENPALRMTISHWPRTMTGSSTRVSGTANAGTAFTIRKRFLTFLDKADSIDANVMTL